MPKTKSGHHGDVVYAFEDNGFDTDPTDTTFKNFGGNVTLDTYDGSKEAVRVFNADRKSAEIIEQVFDGAWSVSLDLGATPPWWLAGLYGQPASSEISTGFYEHSYSIDNSNDPISLRLYAPTDGFSQYEVIPGTVIANATFDQSQPDNPDVTITGAYAREPFKDNSLSPSVPDFSRSTYNNRKAELQVDSTTVGRAQNASMDIEANAEMINEIGSGSAVDWVPRAWTPSLTFDKILFEGQSVVPFDRFTTGNSTSVTLRWDNGESGDSKYIVDLSASGSFPNQWSESGRNDPETDLMEELQEMATDVDATIENDTATPPGA
jgi:hypothetical protein